MSCRAVRPQAELLRLHRAEDGTVAPDDPGRRGRATGRGAYLCRTARCLAAVKPARLARALRTRLEPTSELLDELRGSQRRPSND
ncbi:MAG TPA: DUF448 domain-containing protein [Actinomycetota bacterium]|nr:DUF448 domain-containing protein [Actinomycetota bacterium]